MDVRPEDSISNKKIRNYSFSNMVVNFYNDLLREDVESDFHAIFNIGSR